MADMVSVYMSTPPIARTVATAVFLCSVGVYTGMLNAEPFIFHYSRLIQFPPALYLIVTSFLLTGSGMSVLFDTYFIFNYLSQLETGNSKFSKKEDMIWYLFFLACVILPLNAFFTGGFMLLHALLIALCYTATQDQRGMNAHFYIITIPAQLMPYCLLLVQLLFPNGWESLKIGLTGLVAAHLHDFLTRIYPEFGHGPNLIPTPRFLSWIMSTPAVQNTVYGQSTAPSAGGGRTGPLPDSWRTKGPGRRLG
ncbi:Der1-like family-domain-containing protein [Daldinia caldariorum]|uniref:Der1-like family-domain-containing protein n=1 Tax=Daldinia caldariorum TaxID=326644 RepID=UPI002008D820|nr:Der1-like family-domain-containing protein [Daldinia caldariorum]KAI1468555.1 Der1-like family-domain-containing protein [Daldinia caldariorum]